MLLIFKVTVAAAGTPGPLLGDGVNTTATMLQPSTLTESSDSLGKTVSVINRLAALGRARYTAARITMVGLGSNSDVVYFMAQGQPATAGRRAAPYEEPTPTGQGHVNIFDLGDIDVDAGTSGEGWLVWAEVA